MWGFSLALKTHYPQAQIADCSCGPVRCLKGLPTEIIDAWSQYKDNHLSLARLDRIYSYVDFVWDKLHWIPQSVLFLSSEEGGHGLVHLASGGGAFRFQLVQRLLTGPSDLVFVFHVVSAEKGKATPG